MSFEDDIKAELEKPRPTRDVSAKVNGNVHRFRIERMDPVEWSTATAMFPARPGVVLDAATGYNMTLLTPVVVAKTAKRIDGDDLLEVSEKAWESFFSSISGGVFGRFSDAIFELNQFDDDQELADLKKAFEAGVEKSSRSQSTSASRINGSSAGSRSK